MKHDRQTGAPASAHLSADGTSTLIEVWGDTVDVRHLACSVVLGIAISLVAFEAGHAVLASFIHDAAIARADGMLVGLGGCLLAGALCARLFKPKRVVVERASDDTERLRVLAQLAAEPGGLGTLADLNNSTRAELAELGLLDLFTAYEARAAQDAHATHLQPGAR
ncbi:hypothetical protein [Paraburkholderia sp. J94]|uniref:hypothetical protein n=1 Tax=Paraburkholderia sp. J94 TaxID=2805441 RepID=UPI002AB30E0A|nr:hypothetical protein [Paraburkholderia sp. J94]